MFLLGNLTIHLSGSLSQAPQAYHNQHLKLKHVKINQNCKWTTYFLTQSSKIGVYEVSLCVLLVFEILCSSTKLTLCWYWAHGVFPMCDNKVVAKTFRLWPKSSLKVVRNTGIILIYIVSKHLGPCCTSHRFGTPVSVTISEIPVRCRIYEHNQWIYNVHPNEIHIPFMIPVRDYHSFFVSLKKLGWIW